MVSHSLLYPVAILHIAPVRNLPCSVDHHEFIFNANGGSALVHLTNPSQTNLVYSIVCLNKQNYHFGKKEGSINAGESKVIEIKRTKGPPGKDAFLIQYAIAEEDGNNQQRTNCYVIGVDQIYVNMYAYL